MVRIAVVYHPGGIDELQRVPGVLERARQSAPDLVVRHVVPALRHSLDDTRLAERRTRQSDVDERDTVTVGAYTT
jgi:hypothetical protein